MKLSAFLLMLMTFASCAASQSTTPVTPWKLELTTAGGFSGRGNGAYTIDSSGNITIKTIGGKSCSFTATADELRRFNELLAKAKPREWKASYAPEDRCCDRIEYTLTLDQAGTVTKTEWIDDPLPMPADLTAIAEAINGGATSLRVVYVPQCK
ncbi:MAG TPA: hypothetical protein VF787_19205 [Thermoanaerobaculia bacterium]